MPESLRLCYERASEAIGWEQGSKPAANGPKQRGIGFAAHDWVGGGGKPPGYAWIKINADGTADESALADAQPLRHNAYKMPLAKALIRRAIESVSSA